MKRCIAATTAGLLIALAAGVGTATAGLPLPGASAQGQTETTVGGDGGNNATGSIGTVQLGGGNDATESIATLQSGPIAATPAAMGSSALLDASGQVDAPLSIGGEGGNDASRSIGTVQLGGGNSAERSVGTVQIGGAGSADGSAATAAGGFANGGGGPSSTGGHEPEALAPSESGSEAVSGSGTSSDSPVGAAGGGEERSTQEGAAVKTGRKTNDAVGTTRPASSAASQRPSGAVAPILAEGSQLPFTGLALWLVVLLAAVTIAGGALVRRAWACL